MKRFQNQSAEFDRRRFPNPIILTLILIFSLSLPSFASRFEKTLADGVIFIQDIDTSPNSPLIVNILKVDPKKPGVKLVSTLAKDGVIEPDATKGREIVSSMVARKEALAGVNADFFPYTGDPLGLAITGGELISEPLDRAALGITASGELVMDKLGFSGKLTTASGATYQLKGINRQRGKNEAVLFTPIFGDTTGAADGVEVILSLDEPVKVNTDIVCTLISDPCAASGTPIPKNGAILSAGGATGHWISQNMRKGDKIKLRFDLKTTFGTSWENVMEAVGGGPWLVRNGEVYIDAAEENFNASFNLTRHPRTAVGATAKGELLLVTVDGRQSISKGISLPDMARLMKKLGAVNAINLDGGGSTAFSIKGIINNSPSEGKERPVANALLVYAPVPPSNASYKFTEAEPFIAVSGEGKLLTLVDETTGEPISDAAKKEIIWGSTGGIGFVNQGGWFFPVKAGKGSVVALVGDKRIVLPVTVVAGQPNKVTAKVSPDPTGAPNLGKVNVSVVDANGNAVSGQNVSILIKGGTADVSSKKTDAKGVASFQVTWDSTSTGAKITATVAGITTTTVAE